jgi:transcription termination factor Rho
MSQKVVFDDLTPLHPDKRIVLETDPTRSNMRVVDLVTPIGFGQRGLIVSPAAGRQDDPAAEDGQGVLKNHPDAYVIMLLIDERPEEVTDMERRSRGPNCEVISTFDEPPPGTCRSPRWSSRRPSGWSSTARRGDLARLDHPPGPGLEHRVPALGQDPLRRPRRQRLQKPKRFFGSARKVEEGGSLTIIATALVDTGSKMDEVIFEEFKGTGNMEIVLDRRLVDKRIWPAIDINRSGTRREEMLMDPEEYRRVCILRRVLNDMNPPDAMELLVDPPAQDQDQRRVPDEHETPTRRPSRSFCAIV